MCVLESQVVRSHRSLQGWLKGASVCLGRGEEGCLFCCGLSVKVHVFAPYRRIGFISYLGSVLSDFFSEQTLRSGATTGMYSYRNVLYRKKILEAVLE